MINSRNTAAAKSDPDVGVISEAECFGLLTARTVGRIAFNGAEGVEIIPVNYSLAGRTVLFCTSLVEVLAQLARGAHDVAFEVDFHSPTGPPRTTTTSAMRCGYLMPGLPGSIRTKPRTGFPGPP
jgi:nitroimidazol reductase NimA-like FMN-containing flavoprotein (pyridoxamine 5'-phosphate oxidase superfamily)